MKKIGIVTAGIFLALAITISFYYVLPNSIIGRTAIWLFSFTQAETPSAPEPLKRVFSCAEPLPEFTLGPYSNPSSSEISQLCACVWEELPASAREFATKLESGQISSPSEALINIFTGNFGIAMERCDAENL